MKGSEFVFNYVHLLYYKCHKISHNRGGSNIDALDWIKNKKTVINPINKKDKCVQYAVIVTLNHEEIRKHLQRITKIKTFINKYKWRRINFPSEKDDQKQFEKNNVTVAFNVKKEKNIYPAYISKYNSNHGKQVILLMIPNREGWHDLAVKELSALLKGINTKVVFIL